MDREIEESASSQEVNQRLAREGLPPIKGYSYTMFKNAARERGVPDWPHRTVRPPLTPGRMCMTRDQNTDSPFHCRSLLCSILIAPLFSAFRPPAACPTLLAKPSARLLHPPHPPKPTPIAQEAGVH